MSNVIYLTKDGFDKLKEELKYLKEVKRVEIAAKLKEAISFWDLSENSEYEEARNEQAQIEVQIRDFEEELKNVEIIEESDKRVWRVIMWSIVKIFDVSWNEELTYKIVWSKEADILWEQPKISNESLVWKALLWKKKWDIVKVKASAWNYEYKILEIK